jgi:hypothetical protein
LVEEWLSRKVALSSHRTKRADRDEGIDVDDAEQRRQIGEHDGHDDAEWPTEPEQAT